MPLSCVQKQQHSLSTDFQFSLLLLPFLFFFFWAMSKSVGLLKTFVWVQALDSCLALRLLPRGWLAVNVVLVATATATARLHVHMFRCATRTSATLNTCSCSRTRSSPGMEHKMLSFLCVCCLCCLRGCAIVYHHLPEQASAQKQAIVGSRAACQEEYT